MRLYEWNGSAWVQRGSDIDGEAAFDYSGSSVSLSSDGSVVAIGAFQNDGNGSNSGHVRLYEWNGSAWVQRGSDIDGEAAFDYSGSSVSLSSDGSVVAIGAYGNDGNGDSSGHVRLYEWNGSAWVQRGSDIDGEAARDFIGSSVSLSSDGSVVALGADWNDGNGSNSGHVRLYAWNGSAWVQRGNDIDGEAANDASGDSVSLSSDGSVVAIGAYGNDGNGNGSGHTRLYEWNGSAWIQRGSDIDGEAAGDESGRSVSLSADGSIVAISAWFNDGNGDKSGHVRIFDVSIPTIAISSDVSSLKAGETAALTFTLSEASTDFVESDVTVSGGSLSNWTAASSTVYTATFTPTADSTTNGVVSVASSKFSDSAGNTNNDGSDSNNTVTLSVDTVRPTIAISSDVSSLKAGETAALTFTLSEASTDFVESDATVSGGSLSNWTAVSSTVYTAAFTPTADSTTNGVVSVASSKFSDSAGNTNNDGSDSNNTVTLSVDTVRPTIAISSDVSSLKAGETAALTFTLSEASTDFVESDATVSGGSLSNWTAVSSTVYTATFTPTPDSTTNGVISVASNQFSDAAGNTNNDGSDSNNTVTLSVDTVRPTIAISSDVSSLKAGETAALTFTLSEASTDFVESDATVSGGSLSNWTAVSSTVYTAAFTPTADSTTDGVISVASSKFSDSAGNTNNDGTDANNSVTLSVDTVRPTIAISSDVSSLKAGETAALTFTLSGAATNFIESDVVVSGGSLSNWTAASSTVYTATFTPTPDSTTNGVISVASNQFSDAAGNTNNDGSDSNNTVTLSVDTVRPTISVAINDGGDGRLNASEDSSVAISGTTSGAVDGQTVSINISSSGGGTPINTTASVNTNVYSLSNLDLSSLNDGTLTVTADVSDLAGNAATQATDTTSKDTAAPTIAISSDVSSLKAGETAALTFTLSEASTDFVESDATVSGGSLSNWTAVSSTVYTATFTPTPDSSTNGVISVASNQFSDAAGNTNNDGSDANNSVTLSVDTVRPTIAISATYNASSGALAVTGANLTANSGADNDIDVSKLTITGEGSNTYTLTSGDVELTSATAFFITLNAADQLQLAGLLNKNGISSGGGTTYNIAAALNWNPGASSSPADSAGNAITVSNVAAPSLSSATYNDSTGVLTLSGSNLPAYPGASNDIDVSKLTITGGSGSTYTLTTGDVELTSATAAIITLNSTDQTNLDSLLNQNGTASTQGTTYNIAAADDWAPGADSSTDIADITGNAITVIAIKPTISVAINDGGDGRLNASEDSSVAISGTTSGAVDGQTVSINISSSGGGTPINTTASVNTNVYSLSNLDLSSLNDGTLTVTADVSDLAGNAATQATDTTSKDTAAPTIAISSDVSSLKAGETAALTFTLSEAATDFVESDVVVSGGSLSNWTAASSTVYTATFTPTADSSTNGVISVASNQFSDAAGNTNNDGSDANNSVTLSVDTVSPTIAISSDVSSLKAGETAVLTFNLSKASTDFVESDVTVSGGSLSNWTAASSTVYTATFTPIADSTTNGVVSVASSKFSDAAGNTNNDGSDANNSVTITVDTTPALNYSELIDIKWLENRVSDDKLVHYAFYGDDTVTSGNYSPVDLSDGWTFSLTGYNHSSEQELFIDSIFQRLDPLLSIDFIRADDYQHADIIIYRSSYNSYMNDTLGWSNEGFGGGFCGYSNNWRKEVVWRDIYENDSFLSLEKGVIVHEIGHALSLNHPGGDGYNPAWNQADSIMSYNNGYIGNGLYYEWYSDLDIQALQSIWGVEEDSTRPTIAISSDVSSLRAGETAALTFTLSEASTDFVESDVSISGGSLSNWTAVSSTVYTATFNPTADSTTDGVISVASSKFSDAAGNTNNDGVDANNTVTLSVDTVRPTIAITSDVSSLKAGETSALTFTLSEASTNFIESDVTLSGGSLSNWTAVSSTVYTATFTPTADSTTNGVISVASSKFSNSSTNNNNDGDDANNTVTLTVDTVRPSILISAATSSVERGGTTTITFTLSEKSLNFGLEDVDVSNGKLVSWSEISSNKYTAVFEQSDILDAEIVVSANSFTDIALNPNVNIERQGILASIPYVYRLRNDISGKYLFSSNQVEIDIITGMDWTNEGIAYKSPPQSLTKTSSLHRYSMNGEGHFYTANEYEKGIIDSTMSWQYEGVAFTVYSHEQVLPEVNTVAVKRYLNTESNIHLYSTSSYEQGILNASPEWVYEGIAWYGETV
ncbi:Ig-like domain-containing protein [Synechococcus sp. WH 8109]|uniref:Ig-like domain-containing protein n=1 Tax=Synechococcus sp. WH 8109 TaxID=166314 RepID=UPI0012EBF6A8|nr:Ig-like domain-containing protein [Synechococcus sp. WH 8109]